jgi:putative flippase GtrA
MRKIERLVEMTRAAARFGVVGAFASAVHLGVASLVLALGVQVMLANTIGFLVALVVSVVGHHTLSFPGRTSFWRGAQRFVPAAIAGFLANNVVLTALIATTGTSYAWLKVAVAILVIPPATFAYAYFFAYKS